MTNQKHGVSILSSLLDETILRIITRELKTFENPVLGRRTRLAGSFTVQTVGLTHTQYDIFPTLDPEEVPWSTGIHDS